MGAAQWTDLILVMVGIILLGVELFVNPGFGVVGILGLVAILGGIFMMLDPGINLPWLKGETIVSVLTQMIIGIVAAIFAAYILFRFLKPGTPFLGKLILGDSEASAMGYTADRTAAGEAAELIGKVGCARSKLRPSGKAIFDGKLYDVVTQGDIIEAEEKIRIIELKGNRIVVEKIEEDQQA